MDTTTLTELERRADKATAEFKQNLEALEGSVSDTVAEVSGKAKDIASDVHGFVTAVDPSKHVQKHPKLLVSAAVVVGGMIGYRLRGPNVRTVTVDSLGAPVRIKTVKKSSLLADITKGLLFSAASTLAAEWGRKKYPKYSWAIDAAESVTGSVGHTLH